MDAGQQRQPEVAVDLRGIGSGMLAAVGGKALNLGLLTAAGLPVPGGFCLTTAAYRAVAAGAGVALNGPALSGPAGTGLDGILAELESLPPDDTAALAALAGRVRRHLLAAPIPAAVAEAVRSGHAAMGEGPVAVRSSATSEDLPFASFAGQQDTYLNITGADEVLDAVRRCWASLWTDRAVTYRAANGIGQRAVSLAVIVQEMVAARTAGVLFTANPVTGRRVETVIDAAPGLGDAVVSGAVNPDHFVLETASGKVLQRQPGQRTANDAGPDGARGSCLADAQLQELAVLGAKAAEIFGTPQDVEWAIDGAGKAWLTQARPITTLYPLPDENGPAGTQTGDTQADGELSAYICASLMQGLVRPVTPMGLAAFRLMGTKRGPWLYLEAGQRLYLDLTPVLRSKAGRRSTLKVLGIADAASVPLLRVLADDPRFAGVKAPRGSGSWGSGSWRPEFARLGGSFALLGQLPAGFARAIFRPDSAVRQARDFGAGLAERLELPEPATANQRLAHCERLLSREVYRLIPAVLAAPAAGYALLGVARWLLRGIAEPGELRAVLRGLPNNVTTEMDLALWEVAVRVRGDPESVRAFRHLTAAELAAAYDAGRLPAVVQSAVLGFLEQYGHRAVAEIDLGVPRWSEEPDHILGVIANYLRLEDPEQAPDRRFARAAREAEAAAESLAARARGPLRARAVRFGLPRARQLAGLRELPKYDVVLLLAEVRRQLAAVGRELMDAGRIAAASDIFFLDFDEAKVGLRGADLKELVAQRRRTYDFELRRRHVPRLLLSDGTDVEAAVAAAAGAGAVAGSSAAGDGRTLTGSPASAGTATGKARVILDPVGAHLEPGEILVAPSTDPGWTPLFLTAGALVMEMGGAISHGAVVAREYGIPAVVGVFDATHRVATGQTITVDGAAGTVVIGDGATPN